MIRTLHEGLLADGIAVPLTKLCAWFGVPRRTVYYKPTKTAPKIDPRFAEPIKAMIEKEPSFGYRTVAWLLGFNKNTVQRVFQIKGWQVRKRPIGMRPRIEAVPSVAAAPNERWSTDLCRVWAGRDGWTTLAVRQENGPPDRFLIFLTDRLPYPRASGMASVAIRQGHDCGQRIGACPDQQVWHLGQGHARVPAEVRQWAGLYIAPLYCVGSQLWAETGVHHAALPPAERHGRACYPNAQGTVHPSPALRQHSACDTRHRRLDKLLQ
jgi:putative transposase